jgi:hypothetical protein
VSGTPALSIRSPVPLWLPVAYGFVVWVVSFRLAFSREVMTLLIGSAIVLIVLVLIRRRAEVGNEGIRVQWIFRSQLIRYQDLRSARPNDDKTRVAIVTNAGKSYELTADETVPDELLQRLWHAIAARAEEAPRDAERHALARAGRSTPEWRAALRELGKPASYRETSMSPERLRTIAENPGLDTELRAAAIVALSGNLDARVIAASSVDPALHSLLAADDDEAIERALSTI